MLENVICETVAILSRPQCHNVLNYQLLKLVSWIHRLQALSSLYRAGSSLAPSQWETSLQSNTISHWLAANLELALVLPADAKHLIVLDNQNAQIWWQKLVLNNSKYVFFWRYPIIYDCWLDLVRYYHTWGVQPTQYVQHWLFHPGPLQT